MCTNVDCRHRIAAVQQDAPAAVLGRGRLALLLALTAAPVLLTTVLMEGLAVMYPRARTFMGLASNILSFAVYGASNWLTLGAVWFVAGSVRLRALGMRWHPTPKRFAIAFAGFVAGIGIYLVVTWLQRRSGLPTTGGMHFGAPTPAALIVLALSVVFTAAFCEEVFFRVLWVGGLATHLRASAAIALSILAFAAIHYPYFGMGGVLFIAAWSIVPAVLFVRTGDFTASLLMHVANNAWAYLAVPVLF